MTIKHTPEPWGFHQDASGDVFISSVETSFHIAEVGSEDDETVIPDALRIVACVNACRGLPTDELEQKGLAAAVGTQLLAADDRAEGQEREIRRLVSIAADAENQLADALNQRDELLSLAERLVQWDIDYPVDCDNGYAGLKALDELIRDNKATIVKIKGEHSQQPNALLDDVYVAGGAA
ncbi:hypothetical protein ACTG25_03555 [Aeromonas sp. 80P]